MLQLFFTTMTEKSTDEDDTASFPSSWDPSDYSFPTDYNDHFETPLVAYQDIQPILKAYLATLNDGGEQIIYDPYYCDGRTARLLQSLGFPHVLHTRRDFYTEPASHYAILVTNPPFSGDHKQRCLDFCVASGKPWLVLLPAYCMTKQYVTGQQGVRYRIPSTTYQYAHPEGTGHAECPFRESVWLCGGFPPSFHNILEQWTTDSLEHAAQQLHVRTGNRPNPKQRRRKTKNSSATTTTSNNATTTSSHGTTRKSDLDSPIERPFPVTAKRSKKKSKYRDSTGKRTKGRF